ILHGSPGLRVLAINATRLEDAQGFVGVQLALRDVTQQKALEEAERALAQRLRRSERMEAFAQLAGGVAHDFNNLLTGILGHADLLRRRIDRERDPKLAWGLDELERSAERAAAITQKLLLFSRETKLEGGVCDVSRALESGRDLLQRIVRENVELALE